MKMVNRNYDSNSLLPVFIDASGESYYQQSQVTNYLGLHVPMIHPPLFNRLATPEEIPILRRLGMRVGQHRGRTCIRLVSADDVHGILEQRAENRRSAKKKCTTSKKFLHRSPNLPVKDKEAPFSIIQLICQALLNSVKEGLTTREITNWISETQPYQHLPNKLPSKVGHALSESQFFEHSLGHPCQWYIIDEYEASLRRTAFIPKFDTRQLSNLLPSVNGMVEIEKPPFSTVKLVGQALIDSPSDVLTFREIIAWIEETYSYYQTVDCSSRVANALYKSKFFVKLSASLSLWSTVGKYEASLRKIAYIPDTGKKVGRPNVDRPNIRARSTTAKGLLLPPETIFIDEASETTVESPDEVQILTGNLLDDEPIVSYSNNNDDNMQSFTEQECQPVQASQTSNTSIVMEQEQPRLAMTVVAASAPQKMKPEILDVINLVKDQPVDPTHKLDCKVNPVNSVTLPTLIDTIDLTDSKLDLQCPICDNQYRTNEALGEHVVTHRKTPPNNDTTKIASETLQNIPSSLFSSNSESVQRMTSSLFGGNRRTPILVFSGNTSVYFTTPGTPTIPDTPTIS